MRRSLLLTCALLVVPATAHAEDDDVVADDDDEQMVIVEPPVAEPLPEAPPVMIVTPRAEVKKWVDVSYSSETMLLDGVAVAMFAYGVATETEPLPGLGILTYAFAPPVVHFTHGNVGKGFADAGIRIISPFLFAMPGLMIAIAASPNDHEERKTAMDIGGYTGMALGAAFAMAVDALLFAKERVPEERAYMIGSRACCGRATSSSSSSSSSP